MPHIRLSPFRTRVYCNLEECLPLDLQPSNVCWLLHEQKKSSPVIFLPAMEEGKESEERRDG